MGTFQVSAFISTSKLRYGNGYCDNSHYIVDVSRKHYECKNKPPVEWI